MKKIKLSLAHLLGLGLGVLGWMWAIRALPTQASRPVFIFCFSLYWLFILSVQNKVIKKHLPEAKGDEWAVNLRLATVCLSVAVILTPLCAAWECLKAILSGYPLTSVAVSGLYWVGIGEVAKTQVANITIRLPGWWRWIETRIFGFKDEAEIKLTGLFKWANANVFLGLLVFTGIVGALECGAICNGIGITLFLFIMNSCAVLLIWFYTLLIPNSGLSPKDLVQMAYALAQKWSVIWLILLVAALGDVGSQIAGLILGFDGPICNLVRIGLALWAIAKMNGFSVALSPEEKKKERWERVKKSFINGPFAGLAGGILWFFGVMLYYSIFPIEGGKKPSPGAILGIGQWSYPFVPFALLLVGLVGNLKEVLGGQLNKSGKYTIPYWYILIMAQLVMPTAARFVSLGFYGVGWLDHMVALELARYFAHGCSITAWGILILTWKEDRDAQLYLLFFLITLVGSVISVPLFYSWTF